jgi:hypothetical protein
MVYIYFYVLNILIYKIYYINNLSFKLLISIYLFKTVCELKQNSFEKKKNFILLHNDNDNKINIYCIHISNKKSLYLICYINELLILNLYTNLL